MAQKINVTVGGTLTCTSAQVSDVLAQVTAVATTYGLVIKNITVGQWNYEADVVKIQIRYVKEGLNRSQAGAAVTTWDSVIADFREDYTFEEENIIIQPYEEE